MRVSGGEIPRIGAASYVARVWACLWLAFTGLCMGCRSSGEGTRGTSTGQLVFERSHEFTPEQRSLFESACAKSREWAAQIPGNPPESNHRVVENGPERVVFTIDVGRALSAAGSGEHHVACPDFPSRWEIDFSTPPETPSMRVRVYYTGPQPIPQSDYVHGFIEWFGTELIGYQGT